MLCAYDLKSNKEVEVLKEVQRYELSPDGESLAIVTDRRLAIVPAVAVAIAPEAARVAGAETDGAARTCS